MKGLSMKALALIRPHAFYEQHVALACASLAPSFIDVHALSDIGMRCISLASVELRLCNHEMTDISHLLFMGVPVRNALDRGPLCDDDFEQQEWAAAFVAAALSAKLRIVNRGAILPTSPTIATKPLQLMFLSKAGWKIPDIEAIHVFDGNGTVKRRSIVESASLVFLILTQKHAFLYPPDLPRQKMPASARKLVESTRHEMRISELDWLTIPLAVEPSGVTACGASALLPPEIGVGGALAVIRSAYSQ